MRNRNKSRWRNKVKDIYIWLLLGNKWGEKDEREMLPQKKNKKKNINTLLVTGLIIKAQTLNKWVNTNLIVTNNYGGKIYKSFFCVFVTARNTKQLMTTKC